MTPFGGMWLQQLRATAAKRDALGCSPASALAAGDWLLLLAAVGLLAYLPAWRGVFTFDDHSWIVHNPRLHALDLWQRRPVTLLTFAANLRLGGTQPVGFHAVNIALHLANTALVYLLIRRPGVEGRPPARPWTAAAGAAVFLLHPAQTDAVTYVSGRPTALMTLFLLLAHLAALRSLDTQRVRYTALSILAFALAVGSKETALAYPALWIAWLVFGRGLSIGRALRRAVPQLAAAVLLLGAMLAHPGYRAQLGEAAGASRLATTSTGRLEAGLGLGLCLNGSAPRTESCTARRIESIAGLARLTVAPWTASIDPGRHPAGAGAVLLTAFLALAAWIGLRRGPGTLAGGVAWSLAALLPTPLLLVRPDPLADRLLYLPMVGLALIAAACAERAARGGVRALATAGLCVLLVGLGASTWQRNRLFRSEISLWTDAVSKNHTNVRAHVNLAWAYERAGCFAPAEAEYREALKHRPALPWAVQGLRRVTSSEGDREP